jgi:hypothetical protein
MRLWSHAREDVDDALGEEMSIIGFNDYRSCLGVWTKTNSVKNDARNPVGSSSLLTYSR